jgi:predicted lipoprotein with Yx(FWY)xxD motif
VTARFGGVVALVASGALVLAACGSSSGKAASQPPASPTTAPASSTGSGAKPVAMTASSKLGEILVDSKDRTLYTLTKNGTPVACTGQCLTFWPPLLLPAGVTTAVAGSGVGTLGMAAMSGGEQVSYHGAPLYRFSMDKAAGETNGEGINAFGGTWHVVKIGTSPTTTSPGAGGAPGASTTTSTSGYGY